MRNPKPNCSGSRRPWRFLIMDSFLFLLLASTIDGLFADSKRNHSLEWQVLTKRNFSSQIRLHQHVLLMVTVPWSGESRALMKEVAHVAAYEQEKFPRLMVIYRNTEKMLADVLGAAEGITIFCYHQSLSYKYQGRLRARNILSSVYHLMSLRPEEVPLKSLHTMEDLETFVESTDKAVLLLEFCGWTPILLGKGKNDGSENASAVQDLSDNGGIFGANLNGETNRTLTPSGKENQKGLKNEKLTCGVENGLSGFPWLGEFASPNDSAPSLENESTGPGVGVSCTFEQFQQFDSYFSKFTTVAREFFLPPERQRFGLVSERSLLSSLSVGHPDSWFAMLHFKGCPNCSKILKEGDDLKSVLHMHHPLVTELEGEGHDLEPALPANEPSIILFVDRSSESSNTRRKSKAALETFRKLALHNQLSHQMGGENSVNSGEFSAQPFQRMRGRGTSDPSDHPRVEFSPFIQFDKLKDKMSVMIINEGGNVALDDIAANAQGKSIRDILADLLKQKKEAKLSLLAKEVGFQLLSDDFEVKLADLLSPQIETGQSDKVLSEMPMKAVVESSVNLDKDNLLNIASAAADPEEKPGVTDVKPSPSLQFNIEKITHIEKKRQLIPVEPDQIVMKDALGVTEDLMVQEKSSPRVDMLEQQQIHHQYFKGFYLFSDGGYQLLRALTAGSKIPSIVILDPISQQHYVFPEEAVFSYSILVDFLDGFLNGSLPPYQRSESVLTSPREATRPPFINLDFHEVDSIPRVTAHTFSELVLGFNKSDTQNVGHAWKKDVLVLFSNSWCGFCQRMELVVREVFRAFKGYLNMLKSGSRDSGSIFVSDNLEDAMLNELPLIFLMDCTLNDCSSLLKSMGQRELYPALMLFPAERKSAVSYRGDMSVTNIIKFITDHGSNSHHLSIDKGILWAGRQKGGRNWIPLKDASPTSFHEEDPVAKGKYHEVLLNNRTPTRAVKPHQIDSQMSDELHEAAPHVVVGSVLIATDKLLNAPPFDKSTILIVRADHITGFQGLITNKHISWDSLQGLDEGLKLVKYAPLSFGGPLIAHRMPLVSLARRVNKEGYSEVFPDVYFLDQLVTIREIEGFRTGNQSANDYWFFLGYSSWGRDQLFGEIAEGSWHISDDRVGQFDWPES